MKHKSVCLWPVLPLDRMKSGFQSQRVPPAGGGGRPLPEVVWRTSLSFFIVLGCQMPIFTEYSVYPSRTLARIIFFFPEQWASSVVSSSLVAELLHRGRREVFPELRGVEAAVSACAPHFQPLHWCGTQSGISVSTTGHVFGDVDVTLLRKSCF